jgi:hypothetical protein
MADQTLVDTADLPHLTDDSYPAGPALPAHFSGDAGRRPGLGVGSYRSFGKQADGVGPYPAGTADQAKPNQIPRTAVCLHSDWQTGVRGQIAD